jgi:excisionase family DNA binding protein
MSPPVKPALTVAEFAAETGVSQSHVRALLREGKLEYFCVGQAVRIRRDVADAIMHPSPAYEAAVQAVVDAAPKLSAAQRDRLATLLADDAAPRIRKRRNVTRRNS